ncbi:MAG: DUF1189 family protein [bacterium]
MTTKSSLVGFFRAIVRSCYDLEFYRSVRTGRLKSALLYAVGFWFLLSVVFSLTVALPEALSLYREVSGAVSDGLPEGTSFEIRDDRFETNLAPGTEFFLGDLVVVVDPTVEGKEFPLAFSDRTGAFVGRDTIFVRQQDGQRELIPFSDLPDVSVTREEMLDQAGRWKTAFVVGVTVAVAVFRLVFGFVALLIDAAVTALLALFIVRAWKLRLDYRQWLSVALYAVTLPSLLEYAFGLVSFGIPFASTVVYLMFILAVAMDERSRPTGEPRVG